MQITVTNGTLIQVQETLSAASGYLLPSSITVAGATSSYSSSTGDITLTSPTSTMSITAVAEEPPTPVEPKTKVGNLTIIEKYLGSARILKEVLNGSVIYVATEEPSEELEAPIITLV